MKKLMILLVIIGLGLSCGWSVALADPVDTTVGPTIEAAEAQAKAATPTTVEKEVLQNRLNNLKSVLEQTEARLSELQGQRLQLANERLQLMGAIAILEDLLK